MALEPCPTCGNPIPEGAMYTHRLKCESDHPEEDGGSQLTATTRDND